MKVTKKIVEMLKEKDEDAFDFIYEKYNKLVYFVIHDITYDNEMSKDLSQDTFIKLLSNIDDFEYKGENSFTSWICTIARNLAYNAIRDNRTEIVADEDVDRLESNENNFKKKMSIYFPNLHYTEVQLLYLYYQCDMSYKEIADYLNENKSKIYRTLRDIEKKLEDE